MSKFRIEPHRRLQEWVADEKDTLMTKGWIMNF